MEENIKKPGIRLSITIVVVMAAILTRGISSGISTISLLIVNIMAVLFISVAGGYRYRTLETGLINGVKSAISAVMILLMVGILIASWIQCGIIPMIIYYGLAWVNPSLILVVTFLLSGILAMCIGSAWGTAGTIGIACVAMAASIGVPVEMAAAAAISGAALGDKLSPLSDSTILASSICDIDIFEHIRSMLYTTVPAILITIIAYFILGIQYRGVSVNQIAVMEIRNTLKSNFTFSPFLFIPFIAMVIMSIKKVSSLAAIMISTVIGIVFSIFFQNNSITEALISLNSGFEINSGVAVVDSVLSKGGIQSMLPTVCISILALGLGGILKEVGYLDVIVNKISKNIRGPKQLVISTFLCGILTLAITINFYVTVVLIGVMFKDIYDEKGLHRSVLSRTIEESNTMMTPLIPWNASCVYYMNLFGLSSPSFAPYMFLVWANFLILFVYIYKDIALFRKDDITGKAIWHIRPAHCPRR